MPIFFDRMAYANRVDPDQTAPGGAFWSVSTLFAIPLSILRNNHIKAKKKKNRYKSLE